MITDLVPSTFWGLTRDDDDNFFPTLPTGLVVSEDDEKVFIEAVVPGIDPAKVEISVDNGVLWIKGKEDREEEKNSKRRYYRGFQEAYYSYRFVLPEEVDEKLDPKAEYNRGKVFLTFVKKAKAQPKKIPLKVE